MKTLTILLSLFTALLTGCGGGSADAPHTPTYEWFKTINWENPELDYYSYTYKLTLDGLPVTQPVNYQNGMTHAEAARITVENANFGEVETYKGIVMHTSYLPQAVSFQSAKTIWYLDSITALHTTQVDGAVLENIIVEINNDTLTVTSQYSNDTCIKQDAVWYCNYGEFSDADLQQALMTDGFYTNDVAYWVASTLNILQ